MKRVLKTLLLWLLIAALPIQGMASVVKASCGPAHHEALPALLMQVQQDDEHDDDAMMHAHHAHHMHADEHHAAASSDDGQHAGKSAYCSACAACCFGAVAPPPSIAWKPVLTRSNVLFTPAIVPVAGYIPAGLERPPRHLFA